MTTTPEEMTLEEAIWRGARSNPSLSKIKAISTALHVHYTELLEEE